MKCNWIIQQACFLFVSKLFPPVKQIPDIIWKKNPMSSVHDVFHILQLQSVSVPVHMLTEWFLYGFSLQLLDSDLKDVLPHAAPAPPVWSDVVREAGHSRLLRFSCVSPPLQKPPHEKRRVYNAAQNVLLKRKLTVGCLALCILIQRWFYPPFFKSNHCLNLKLLFFYQFLHLYLF